MSMMEDNLIPDDAPELSRKQLSSLRWIVVGCLTILKIAERYTSTSLSSVRNELNDDIGMSNLEYNASLACTNVFGAIVPFVAGWLVDTLGSHRVCFATAVGLCVGQAVISIGTQTHAVHLVFVGRLILGMFVEALDISMITTIFTWVRPNEGALAMSFAGAGGAIGIALSFFTANQLLSQWGLHTMIWSACWLMGVGIVATAAIWVFETMYKEGARSPSQSVQHDISESVPHAEIPYVTAIKSLPMTFWILTSIAALGYSVTELFNGNLTGYIQDEGYSYSYANNVLVVGYCSFIVTGPVLGSIVDRFGNFPTFLILANIIKAVALLFMMHKEIMNPYISVFIFMVGFSTFNAGLWPSLQKSIPAEEMMGRAFGMVSTIQNLTILLALVVGGSLLPPKHSWMTFMWYCFFLAIACLVLSLFVAVTDIAGDQALHTPDRKLSSSVTSSGVMNASPVVNFMTRSPIAIRTPTRTPRGMHTTQVVSTTYNNREIPIPGRQNQPYPSISHSAPTGQIQNM